MSPSSSGGALLRRLPALLPALLLAAASLQALAAPRIVDAAAPVQSTKRGLAANSMSAADFRAIAPGVSWYYTWNATPLDMPSDVSMEFIPMAWNHDPSFQTNLSNYLAAGNRPRRIFVNNEPNLKGQAFITPSTSANLHAAIKAIAAPYGIPVVGPHMALGSAPADSITAYDPLLGANTTYTTGSSFLEAFFHYAGAANVESFGYHTYGNSGEAGYFVDFYHTTFNKPMWVTEFSHAGAGSQQAMINYMMTIVDLYERTPWIEGYAWFMARNSGIAHSDIFASGSGTLSPVGQVYVQMPVHDAELFHRIPGRLQAERYSSQASQQISPTTDSSGFADMGASSSTSSLDYKLFVPAAGLYTATLRVSGSTSPIKVHRDGALLAQVTPSTSSWSDVPVSFTLEAGMQSLTLSFASASQRINWLEFAAASAVAGTPRIIEHPASQVVTTGTAVTLGVALESAGSFAYQWYRNGVALSGANTATLSFAAAQVADTGSYHVVVSSGSLQDVSTVASLTVADAPPAPWLANISTNSFVGTGAELQVAGFVIKGTQPKKVLIRASGPTLAAAPFHVPGTLADPVLTLFLGQTAIASNDNWSDDATLAAVLRKAFSTTQAFSFLEGSKDAALLVTLAPGNYTVQTSGKNSGTGIALIEVYEVDNAAESRLVNLSTLSPVRSGNGKQIAGFVIKGTQPRNLLVRASGPAIGAAPFHVPGTLADPQLVLFSANAQEMNRNLDWDSVTLPAVFSSVSAFPWASGSKDAALSLSLPAGNYTAQVSGQDDGNGVSLVELYELP